VHGALELTLNDMPRSLSGQTDNSLTQRLKGPSLFSGRDTLTNK